MNGGLIVRGLAVLLAGVLPLVIGAAPANAAIIDEFSGVSPAATAVFDPPSFPPPSPPIWTLGPTSWTVIFAPIPPLSSAVTAQAKVTEPAPIPGVGDNGSRTTTVAGVGMLSAAQSLAVVVNSVSPSHNLSLAMGSMIKGGGGTNPPPTNPPPPVPNPPNPVPPQSAALTIQYSFPSPGLDLTLATGIDLSFLDVDQATKMWVQLNGINGANAYTIPASPNPQVIDIPLSDFTGVGSSLNSALFEFDGGNLDLDFTLDSISTTVIPEPLALAIWFLAGVAGVGMVRVCRGRR